MKKILILTGLCIITQSVLAQKITVKEAREDLDSLKKIIENYSSYYLANRYPYTEHIDSLKSSFSSDVSTDEFGLSIRELVGRFQDSHSAVEWSSQIYDKDVRKLPFPVLFFENRVIVGATDGCGLMAKKFPYLKSINEVKTDRLLEIAGIPYRGHSPQRQLSRAVQDLDEILRVLDIANALDGDLLKVKLTNDIRDTTLNFTITERQPSLLQQNNFTTRTFSGDIAYLKIEGMWENNRPGEDLHFEMIRAAMESRDFAESRGMVIDLRGNTGGSRDLIHYLLPYFMDGNIVYNVVFVRHDTTGLTDRNLFSPDDPDQSTEWRNTANDLVKSFKPQWELPKDKFLNQIFVAVAEDHPTPYDYSNRPVVVLMDEWSFSATDVFLAALKQVPNVTLMGTPSAGGSGRSRWFELPNSKVRVRLSTMASFQPNGSLFDGNGVQPDTIVTKTLEHLLGQRDSQLGPAIRLIQKF